METYRVHIADKAFDEIKSQFHYIQEESPRAAVNWLRAIHSAIDTLEQMPRRCPHARENEHTDDELRQLLFRKNWRVLFTIEEDIVHVVRVRHARQREIDRLRESSGDQEDP